MAGDASWPVRKAVMDVVTAAVSPVPVYDMEPLVDADAPYVVVGEATSQPWDDKDDDGQKLTLTLHAWTQSDSGSSDQSVVGGKAVIDLLAVVRAALHRQPLTVAGRTVVQVVEEFTTVLRHPEPQEPPSMHGVARYRIWTAAD